MFSRFYPLALLVVVATMISGCAELERPEAYSPSPDSILVIGEAESASQENEEQSAAAESVDDFVPSVEGYVSEILIAAEPQSLKAAGTVATVIPALEEIPVATMADDLVGGLIVGRADGPVVYLHGQDVPETIDDAGAQLLDVGYWGGSPRAFLLVGDSVIDWVQLVSEQETASRQRQTHLTLPEGESVASFSASREFQAIATSDADCGTLRFYNRNGTDLTLPGPGDPECTFPGRPTYGTVALSPDGAAVAYTIVEYRADGTEEATELVVRELIGAVPFFQRRIGEGLDRITSLAFDGNRVVYLRESGEESSVIVLDVTGNETPITVAADTIASVSFARNPVTAVE